MHQQTTIIEIAVTEIELRDPIQGQTHPIEAELRIAVEIAAEKRVLRDQHHRQIEPRPIALVLRGQHRHQIEPRPIALVLRGQHRRQIGQRHRIAQRLTEGLPIAVVTGSEAQTTEMIALAVIEIELPIAVVIGSETQTTEMIVLAVIEIGLPIAVVIGSETQTTGMIALAVIEIELPIAVVTGSETQTTGMIALVVIGTAVRLVSTGIATVATGKWFVITGATLSVSAFAEITEPLQAEVGPTFMIVDTTDLLDGDELLSISTITIGLTLLLTGAFISRHLEATGTTLGLGMGLVGMWGLVGTTDLILTTGLRPTG